jgi:hypothetical protein
MVRRLLAWIAAASAAVLACTALPQRPTICQEGTPDCEGPPRASPEGPGPSTEGPGGPEEPPEPPAPDAGVDADGGALPDADPTIDSGPPTKPASCLSPADVCFHIQTKCGCQEDCCSGMVCQDVYSLHGLGCCLQAGAECAASRDCCGLLVCRPGDAGKSVCVTQ